jgi:hypothetical protein
MTNEKRKNTPDLMHALSFTDADLKANREGYMTFEQRQKLRTSQTTYSWFFGVGGIIFAIIGVMLVGSLFMPSVDKGTGGIAVISVCAVVFTAGIILGMAWLGLRIFQLQSQLYQADLHKGEVQQVTGVVVRQLQVGNKSVGYELLVGEERFRVSAYTYKQFTDGAAYTLYFTPNTKTLLAAELLESDG